MPAPSPAPNPIDCDATRVRGSAEGVQLQFGRIATGPLLQVSLSPLTAVRLRDALAQALRQAPQPPA
jgi:hypothetical protein